MAIHANSTPVPAVASLQVLSNAAAQTQMTSVQNVADALAEMMAGIHGGKWRTDVDHECGFIVIRALRDRPIQKPKRGEVA